MKATFQIPDELYREVKAVTAREGRTVREVTIGLFEQWRRERKSRIDSPPAIDCGMPRIPWPTWYRRTLPIIL